MSETVYTAGATEPGGGEWEVSMRRQRVDGGWQHIVGTGPHDGVVVVARNAAGELAMVREFRHPVATEVLNLPRGYGTDRGPVKDAIREFQEEAGLELVVPVVLGHVWPDSGLQDTRIAVVAGRVEDEGGRGAAGIELVWTDAGRLGDQATVDGISAAALWLESLRG